MRGEAVGQDCPPQDATWQAETTPCPVCRACALVPFQVVDASVYWRCEACQATLLDPAHRLEPDAERAHYDLHDNDVADAGYRRFLARLADPLLARLPQGRLRGLDYGCGPGPALAAMLREAGHDMAVYDPFYAPAQSVLATARHYDFITCTEVLEHVFDPAVLFDQFDRLLKPGGWLGLMTCFQTDDARFAGWHYRKDPTHVVFFRETTLRHVADQRGWACDVPTKDVAIMRNVPAL